MHRFKLRLAVVTATLLVLSLPLFGATVLQMNLGDMVGRADKIFRGTVLDVREGTLPVGGGQLPVVTYRLRVDEPFKGSFDEVKGLSVAEITMVGKLKSVDTASRRFFSALPDLPKLRVGQDYLLLVTAPSSVGLSAPVGLSQGTFTVAGKPGQELAVNGNNNLGLGLESSGFAPPPAEGPVPYSTLAEQIRGHLGN